MAQGIPFDKEKVLEALEPYFKLGYGIPKACRLAEFNDEVLYDWIKQDPSLLVKINAWQGMLDAKAREVIAKSLIGDQKNGIEPNLDTAKWWAERKERKDFSTRQEQDITSQDEPITSVTVEVVHTTAEDMKELEEMKKDLEKKEDIPEIKPEANIDQGINNGKPQIIGQ